jgi:hypothetical protein
VEEKDDSSLALLSANELSALAAIMQFYEQHLWNSMAPSVKRSRQAVEVSLLIVKLFLLPSGKEALLTGKDLEHIKAALAVFTSQVENMLPPSESRDGVLTSCHQLGEALAAVVRIAEE